MENKHTFSDIQFEIATILDIPDDQLSDDQRKLINDYLNELGQEEASKIDAFSGFIRKQSAIAEAIKEESKHLADKARAIQNKIDYLKRNYIAIMQRYGVKKIQGNVYSIGIRENTRVEVKDIEALKILDNPAYLKTKIEYTPDKTAIKEAIIGGREIPGCSLEKSYSLNIR